MEYDTSSGGIERPVSATTPAHIPPTAARDRSENVQGTERIGSGVLGSAFLLWGVRREGAIGMLAMAGGLGLLARAATGRCAIKRALEPSPYASSIARARGWPAAQVSSAAVTIARPRAEVYKLWRDFSNLPRFMKHVETIEVLTPHRSRWLVKAPLGKTVSWISYVTEDIENERIAWESEGGAEVPNYGWIELRDAPGDRGTEISALIAYRPPFGTAGRLMGAVLRETPEHQMRDDLRRLKQILETGEVAASQEQFQS